MFLPARKTSTLCLGILVALSYSCSKPDSSTDPTEGSAITVEGTLALNSSAGDLRLTTTPTLEELSIYCVSNDIPPSTGTATVAEDGSFSLSIDAYDVAISCSIIFSGDVLGVIVFQDPAKKNLNGEVRSYDSLAFSSDVNFGSFTLDLATGLASIDITTITGTLKINSGFTNPHDFSGIYTFSRTGLEVLPEGYVEMCETDVDCEGMFQAKSVWINRVNGKYVADGTDGFLFMKWEKEEDFEICDRRLGFTYEEGKNLIGIDFSESNIEEGPHNWDPNLKDGWKHEEEAMHFFLPDTYCRDMPTNDAAGRLAQLKCYERYYGNLEEEGFSTCAQYIRANWEAQTPEEFLYGQEGPLMAYGQLMHEVFEYNSPTSGIIRSQGNVGLEGEDVDTGDFIECIHHMAITVSFKKYPDSDDLLAQILGKSVNLSKKPECIAAFGSGPTFKFMIRYVKQP